MPTIQITNPADYNSTAFKFECDYPLLGFAIPAWDEIGLPELDVDCFTRADAEAILRKHRDYLEWRGYRVAL